MRVGIEHLLESPEEEFKRAVDYVLMKERGITEGWLMPFSTLEEVLQIHDRILERTGGARGTLDLGLLDRPSGNAGWPLGDKKLIPRRREGSDALLFDRAKSSLC